MPKKTISVPEDVDLATLQKTLEDLREEKIWVEWEAPERSFKQMNKDFWITSIAILVLVSVILIFVKEFFLIMALASALFLAYVLTTVPPGKVKNKITNRGVYFSDVFYPWTDLARFWFGKSVDNIVVNFETQLRFPREVTLIIDGLDQNKLKEVLLRQLPLVETSPKFVDKATVWLGKKLPLEDRPK
ncbi:hypothetical protein M1116_01370 [Patescibacteria group bacterium]|nr:hypothetical protein [Patescibacteria group bacterium]